MEILHVELTPGHLRWSKVDAFLRVYSLKTCIMRNLSLKSHLVHNFYKIHLIIAPLFPAAKAANRSYFFIGKNCATGTDGAIRQNNNTCFDDTWMKISPKWLNPNRDEPLSVPSAQLRAGLFLALWGPSANCCLGASGLSNCEEIPNPLDGLQRGHTLYEQNRLQAEIQQIEYKKKKRVGRHEHWL